MCYLTWKKTEWQGKIGLKTNKKREEQKNEGINFIRQKFNIDTDNNNISDAIMIAYATCIQVNKTQGKV
jgi:hypothetical protein